MPASRRGTEISLFEVSQFGGAYTPPSLVNSSGSPERRGYPVETMGTLRLALTTTVVPFSACRRGLHLRVSLACHRRVLLLVREDHAVGRFLKLFVAQLSGFESLFPTLRLAFEASHRRALFPNASHFLQLPLHALLP